MDEFRTTEWHDSTEEYKIPEYIKELIDIEFLQVFKKNIESIWKPPLCYWDYVQLGSTGGWFQALQRTCVELNKMELIEYWNNLEWFDSDIFDGELADILLENNVIEKGEVSEFITIENW